MARGGIRVSVNLDAMNRRFSKGNRMVVQDMLGEQVAADMYQFVPMRRGGGDLRKGRYHRPSKAVVYRTPYAQAQFRGTNGRAVFRKYTTPGTGKRWDLKAKSRYGRKWRMMVAQAYTK